MGRPADLETEYEGLALGDARLERRAMFIVKRAVAAPSQSFPELLPRSAELEAAYRFFQNDSVSADELLWPHIESSIARSRRERVFRVVHDTTSVSFGGSREGCGALASGGSGFWAHVALIVSGGEERAPLGVAGLETKVYPTLEERRADHAKRVRQYRREKLRSFPKQAVVWPKLEKWSALPLRLRGEVTGSRAVHVMDREADITSLMVLLKKKRMRFVIRGTSGRLASGPGNESVHVQDVLDEAAIVLRRRVRLTARPKPSSGHSRRDERDATLSMRAARVTLKPATGRPVAVNAVEVLERKPPEGEEPINWVLYTTDPVSTSEEIAAVVDHYRARWRIEEYFKALKTGCGIEKRQLTSYDGLKRALALFMPIAWHLMALRTAAHQEEPAPAKSVMTPEQLTILRALATEREITLSEAPTAREALLAVAALGGHLKRNGDPGWLTLGRGHEKLRTAEAVWRLAISHAARCDQS